MSSMFNRALMVMRSLSLKTHAFTLCVIAGTLLLCLGFFQEPNIDFTHTTSVHKEMETASASDLTIYIEVESLSVCAGDSKDILEVNEISIEDIASDDSKSEISFDNYMEFARLIEAEASSEDLRGRTLVASVVMNRVASELFPDTVTEVINDPGQFDPVDNYYINYAIPTHESKQAVIDALKINNGAYGALYFQKSAATEWGDKQYLFRYGNHSFYK